MKNKMPSEGLRLGRDSGSILCDTLKKWRFRTGWGGYLPKSAKVPGSSNPIEADGKQQLSDEKLVGVDGGIIPPLPKDPTTSTL